MKVFSFLLLLLLPAFGQDVATVSSPSGDLQIAFQAPSGQLVYEVKYRGKTAIAPSNLGLHLQGGPPLGEEVRIAGSSEDSADETYNVVHGKSNPVRNHYRSLSVEVVETSARARRMLIEARAYDDGVAFRYHVPDQGLVKDFRLADELTEFRLPKDCSSYPLFLRHFRTSYEDRYVTLPVSRIAADRLIAAPLLIDLSGVGYIAITEANLTDYAAMYLRRNVSGASAAFRAALAPRLDEAGLKVLAGTPHGSPWRVIMVADDPGRLIESNIIINLNLPGVIADTSWIKPGKSAWDWWYGKVDLEPGFPSGMNTRTFLHLIDFAAESGLDYVLVDDGWTSREDITKQVPDIDIRKIIDYGKSKGVGTWLWLHWTGVDRHMNQMFPLFEKWGAVGLKIDFMDRDDQWMVNWYHRVLKKAAEHHLMVDFHGAYKPTGIRRTYPHLMTRKGVIGLEYTKWSQAVEPEHNVTLPFTRGLVGPMDFTPGGFDNVTREEFTPRFDDPIVLGTRAHQLAASVVFESPYLVFADHPSAYRGEPAFEFLKAVPTTWDETRVLSAQVADYIAVARRSGDDWYIGSMTDWTARELEVPLSFLGSGMYTAEIYADGSKPTGVDISNRAVEKSTILKLRLASGGGQAIRIYK